MRVKVDGYNGPRLKVKGQVLYVWSEDGSTYHGRLQVTKSKMTWFAGKKQTGSELKWRTLIDQGAFSPKAS